jgi:amidase
MTGVEAEDAATAASAGQAAADYTKYLDTAGLRGARLGIVRKYFGFSDAVDALINQRIEEMKHAGAEVVDPVNIPILDKLDANENLVLQYELKADLAAYLARLGPSAPMKSLKDVIDFNDRNRDKEMPWFGQDTFLKAEAHGPLSSKEYRTALETNRRLSRTQGIDLAMSRYKLDALVAPTAGPAWLTDLINGDHDTGGSSTLAAVAGYPSITIPAGFVSGLPVGISFFGRAWSEPALLKIAYAFEQLTKARQKPGYRLTSNDWQATKAAS